MTSAESEEADDESESEAAESESQTADTSSVAEPTGQHAELIADLLDGRHRALARVITKIENRAPGYREIVSQLHDYTGSANVVGITGSPGAGKSTLVDKLAKAYRDRGDTVGVIAVDPSSPYTGGAVLGDRIRMASNVGDMDVFFRSMSARGSLGGLSTATSDAVKALDAFGKDQIIIETVGAGQNEVDIVKTAETVCVLVQPGSGDDVQMLKAGILEIGDVFVVNKADMEGATRTVAELEEMLHMRENPAKNLNTGHHGPVADEEVEAASLDDGDEEQWDPEVIETIATEGDGVPELIDTFDEHRTWLEDSGQLAEQARTRYAEEIQQLLRADTAELLEELVQDRGGVEALAGQVVDRETDPYAVTDELMEPLEDCLTEELDEPET
jgi:LAO/AO transport system kinase